MFGERWTFTKGELVDRGKMMIVVTYDQNQRLYGKDAVNLSVEELMYCLTYKYFYRWRFTRAFFELTTATAQLRVDLMNVWMEHVMYLEMRETIKFKGWLEERWESCL